MNDKKGRKNAAFSLTMQNRRRNMVLILVWYSISGCRVFTLTAVIKLMPPSTTEISFYDIINYSYTAASITMRERKKL